MTRHKGSFLSRVCASNNQLKLALIPQFCYYLCDFGGVDWPLFERLIQRDSSLSGGEKPANQGNTKGYGISLAERISSRFGGAARAIGVGALATTVAFSTQAFADDAPKDGVTNHAPAQAVSMDMSATTNLIGDTVTRKEAFRASTDQIVLHVGDGVEGVEASVLSLKMSDYKVSAFYGGEFGKVDCFVARRRCGSYDQADIFDATMSGVASIAYDERLGAPEGVKPVDLAMRP